MRIGIDARLGGAKHAGIGRYVEELLRGLIALQSKHTWVVFCESRDQFRWLEEFAKSSGSTVELRVVPVRHYTFREQVFMPIAFLVARLDLLHVPHFNVPLGYGGRFIITIHDLLWHEVKDHRATTLPPWLHGLKHRAYKLVAEHAIRRAQVIIVPSKEVKRKLLDLNPRVKAEVIYEGVTPVEPSTGYRLASLKDPFLLYVGSLYPHKNVESVLRALKLLPDYTLVVCSSRSVFSEKFVNTAKKIGVQERLRMLGYVSDADVASLEKRAIALIQPSKSEGFGLTGLEALCNGAPVLASDIPVFREIYGEFAVFTDTSSPRAIADAVLQLAQQQSYWREKIQSGKADLLQKYNWPTMARHTLELYERQKT